MTFDQLQERMRQQQARQAAREAARRSTSEPAAPPVPEIPPSVGRYAAARRDALPLMTLVHAAGQAMEAGDMATCRQHLSTANELHGSAAVDRYLSTLT